MRIEETSEALEIRAPWVAPSKRIALLLMPLVFFSLWVWTESERAAEHPAVLLVPLPIFSFGIYMLAAIAFGSTRVRIGPDAIEWRYGGLPTLPSRRIARADVSSIGYWQQTVPTRFGSYTTGVAGLVLRDGTRVALLDSLDNLDAAETIAMQIGRWLGNVQVQHTAGWPIRRDPRYVRWMAFAGGFFCLLLLATAALSEYYHI
jgi:hypothetical protein